MTADAAHNVLTSGKLGGQNERNGPPDKFGWVWGTAIEITDVRSRFGSPASALL
jgi:hypothetical protein